MPVPPRRDSVQVIRAVSGIAHKLLHESCKEHWAHPCPSAQACWEAGSSHSSRAVQGQSLMLLGSLSCAWPAPYHFHHRLLSATISLVQGTDVCDSLCYFL